MFPATGSYRPPDGREARVPKAETINRVHPEGPSVPREVDALGIPPGMVQDLVLRMALLEGKTSTVRLSQRLAIGPGLMTKIVEEMRDRQLFEVIGIEGRDYIVQLTDEGRRQASERMGLCRYVGPAPVNLSEYTAMIESQRVEPDYDLDTLRDAFRDLVISDKLL